MNAVWRDRLEQAGVDKGNILKTWRELVEIESYTHSPESVKKVCDYIQHKLEALGMRTRVTEYPQAGPLLIGEWGTGEAKDGILLTGHMDTVFKLGTLSETPFRVAGDQVYGPGVLDMKGGINLIFYILKLLKAVGYQRPIKVILSGDEEHGHENSDQDQQIIRESSGYKLAFNMETGLMNNGVTVARKGRIACRVVTRGKSAHAGANINDGINAIHEMAHKIVSINQRNGMYGNATFSVGTITGGTVPNAVPDFAEAVVDVRYDKPELQKVIEQDLIEIADKCHIRGASGEAIFDSNFPPFSNHLNGKAFQFFEAVSEANGFGKPTPMSVGGSSDASFITMANVPCLCSVGVKGEWNHTNREYALLSSAVERIVLVTDTILAAQEVESFL